MIVVEKKLIPAEILKFQSCCIWLLPIFQSGSDLNRRLNARRTRGFVLSTLWGGAVLNQNQIATVLGFDRTVVHRCIRSMIQEGLVSERKANSGRALLVQLTPKGTRYREYLIKERQEAEEKLRKELTPEECTTLVRLLKVVAELEL
jgi:DNA-binding MarR family transcriptional regulator